MLSASFDDDDDDDDDIYIDVSQGNKKKLNEQVSKREKEIIYAFT